MWALFLLLNSYLRLTNYHKKHPYDNLDSVGDTTTEDGGGGGLSPEIFQLLLKGIDTIMNRIYPETYGKISVEDRTEIPRTIVRHFPAISIEQLEEIELMVDDLIKEYKKMHSMAVTFYQRPKDEVMQKKRCNSHEDDHVVVDKEEDTQLS